MCKTLEETAIKIKKLEEELETIKKELEILRKAQCPLCRQRMENLAKSEQEEWLRLGD